jgi:cell division protein ZipA
VLAIAVAGFFSWRHYKKQQEADYVMPFERSKFSLSQTLSMKRLGKSRAVRSDDENQTSLIIINLYAPNDHGFGSYDLLQALTSAHLHFGRMKIFQRHFNIDGGGEVLFNVASITHPGTFDIDNMAEFFTPGLTLFAEMDKVEDPVGTFDLMLETAIQLADGLGGTLYEGRTSPLTTAAIERIRQQLYNRYKVASTI